MRGLYSDWDSLLLKYGGEIFRGRRSIFCISILIRFSSGIQPEVADIQHLKKKTIWLFVFYSASVFSGK
jgi:hypothetical protein